MSALPRLHRAKVIASALDVSEWWVLEQCRRGLIPFVKVGGSYRFTEQHLTEIVELYEQRPDQPRGTASPSGRRRSQPRQRSADDVVPLRARQPRRRPKAG